MNKVLAFFLGMLFGIIFILGAMGLGIYIAITTVTPTTISPSAATYLGSMADMSLLDIVNSVRDLYLQKIGITDENGRYYSVGEFLQYYEIDPATAFGITLPEAVLEIPAFELFSDGGFDKMLKQVKVSSAIGLAGTFTNGTSLSEDVVAELSQYSLSDLFDQQKGIAVVFQNVSMADILPDSFPDENTDNTIMWAVGQAKIGQLYAAMGSSGSLFLQFTEGGAFEALGTVPIAELLGGTSGTIGSVLGQSTLGDMVDENGAVNVDNVVSRIYLGNVFSCMRNEITSIDTYTVNTALSNGNEKLYEKTSNQRTVYAKEDNGYFYQSDLLCNENHTHDIYCYDFVWYNQKTHNGALPDDYVDAEGRHARVTGIYKALVNRKLADMMTGSSDDLIDSILTLNLGELLGDNISGIMENFADMSIKQLMGGGIDSLYLGALQSFTRTPTDAPDSYVSLTDGEKGSGYIGQSGSRLALSDDSRTWYEAKLICEEAHTHTRDCYSYVWLNGEKEADGIAGKLADMKVSQLNSLNDAIRSLTLRDVLGDSGVQKGIFAALADVTIGDLPDEIDKMYLGDIINSTRLEIDDAASYTPMTVSTSNRRLFQKQTGTTVVYARQEDGVLYEAKLICNNKNITHSHTAECYNYVWYNTLGHGTAADDDVQLEDGLYHSPIKGVYKAFVNVKLGEMSNGSSEVLMKEIKKLSLSDLMGNGITGVMTDLADMTVDELLGGGVEEVYLGTFFAYKRAPYLGTIENMISMSDGQGNYTYAAKAGEIYCLSENGTEWFEAELRCTENHEHNARACYTYVWYKSCANPLCNDLTHRVIDGETYNKATGMMYKLADEKVEGLRHLNSTIQSLTLGDVLGDNLTGMLLELKDTPLGSVSTAVNNIYLGTAVNCHRNAIDAQTILENFPELIEGSNKMQVHSDGVRFVKTDDGEKWYEAEFDCNTEGHTTQASHTASCYVYVWYSDEACTQPVTGITKAFVNSKLNNVNETLTANVKKLTLEDIGIDCTNNNILTSLRTVPLSGISREINDMKLGVVLGYVKKECSVPEGYSEIVYSDGEYIYVQHTDGKYYHARLNCKNTSHYSAELHNRQCYEFVWYESLSPLVEAKGINGKMSNTSIADLGNGGLTSVVKDMTVGDLIDSGMMNLTEDDMYKLDIIFDDTSVTPHCTLKDYTIYRTTTGRDAKSYYQSVHQNDETYRGSWKKLKLQEFISALLRAI